MELLNGLLSPIYLSFGSISLLPLRFPIALRQCIKKFVVIITSLYQTIPLSFNNNKRKKNHLTWFNKIMRNETGPHTNIKEEASFFHYFYGYGLIYFTISLCVSSFYSCSIALNGKIVYFTTSLCVSSFFLALLHKLVKLINSYLSHKSYCTNYLYVL